MYRFVGSAISTPAGLFYYRPGTYSSKSSGPGLTAWGILTGPLTPGEPGGDVSRLKRWQTAAEVEAHRRAQAKYQKSPEEIRKRENRNAARADLERQGKAHKGDGKDVIHKNGSALDNSPINYRLGSRHKNRSYKRTPGAHKLDPRS